VFQRAGPNRLDEYSHTAKPVARKFQNMLGTKQCPPPFHREKNTLRAKVKILENITISQQQHRKQKMSQYHQNGDGKRLPTQNHMFRETLHQVGREQSSRVLCQWCLPKVLESLL
jgi:hypothetical protein